MRFVPNLGEMVRLHAHAAPDRIGGRDSGRTLAFGEWNRRARRLANGLLGLGLAKGDRVAVLAYNCIEWLEIYAATAKAGLVAVPVNFRLVAAEIRFVVGNAGARAVIVQDDLLGPVEEIRAALGDAVLVHFGGGAAPAGCIAYERLIADAADAEPPVEVRPDDPWVLMYTSGTTGAPKGAVRSHAAGAMISLVSAVELGFGRSDVAHLAMPLCHANSLYFLTTMACCGGVCSVYDRRGFDPEDFLRTMTDAGGTFTSLVPTHYAIILDLPPSARVRHPAERVSSLLISSAPARQETKRAIMDFFPNAGLFETYGSTEAGWVTMLHPDEQFSKLGSIGRECVGSAPIRLLGEDGGEVPAGEVGELYSLTPYTFDGYWGLPEKTAESFRGAHCSVGDMARRDEDGYYFLVDRKSNMIISGGENVYPTEVEAAIAAHPAVRDVAVIGLPDDKWGEAVHAVIVPAEGAVASEAELLAWCRTRIAGYKRPRGVTFVRDEDMPRTATGKIQHRLLRNRVAAGR